MRSKIFVASTVYSTSSEGFLLLPLARSDAQSHELFERQRTQVVLQLKDWLLACISHPRLDTRGILLAKMQPLVVPQPKFDRNRDSDYTLHRSERVSGGFGLWPSLTKTLAELHPAQDAAWTDKDEHNIVMAVTAHLRLASNVVKGRKRPYARYMPWEEYTLECERRHACILESPLTLYPLRV